MVLQTGQFPVTSPGGGAGWGGRVESQNAPWLPPKARPKLSKGWDSCLTGRCESVGLLPETRKKKGDDDMGGGEP